MAGWTTPKTWVPGVLPSADLNTYVRDNLNFLYGTGAGTASRPRLIARQTVVQSIPNNAWTPLLFDTNDIDSAAGHSTTTNTSRYTCQVAGEYLVAAGMCMPGQAAAGIRLHVNGAVVLGSRGSGANSQGMPVVTRLVDLNVGDYLEVGAFQNTGAAVNTTAAADDRQSFFTAQMLGAT